MSDTPILNAIQLATIAINGGYSNLVPMSEATNLLLLSALPFLSERWIWETKLQPITDALYNLIIEEIDTATRSLMSNLSIGTIFYSVALLTDPSLLLPIGQVVAQSDYAELTAVVPSSWLVGADIQLPDMRESFVIGADLLSTVGISRGSNTEQLTVAEIPSHNHSQIPHSHTYTQNIATPTGAGPVVAGASIVVPTPAVTSITTAQNQATGGDGSHNNVPKSMQTFVYLVAR